MCSQEISQEYMVFWAFGLVGWTNRKLFLGFGSRTKNLWEGRTGAVQQLVHPQLQVSGERC